MIELRGVTKHFDTGRSVLDRVLGRPATPVRAVEDVDLTIRRGEILGIAGESGCGKTTLGKLLVKLTPPTAGEIRFEGRDLWSMTPAAEREFRTRVQMIFQDPFGSLNPRLTVFDAVAEPLRINGIGDGYRGRRERVRRVLADVGLAPPEPYLDQFPGSLSGGERQRVAIARALVVEPDVVVADEPVSMLDVSIRASVLNLLLDLRDAYDLTYVFISHDLSIVRFLCDRMAVMYLGDVVEVGETTRIAADPGHPYTAALFDAVPSVDPRHASERADVAGEIPSPRHPPAGCKFHPRCPAVIPPDGWAGSQEAFRRVVGFKSRLAAGEPDPGRVADRGRDRIAAVLEVGLDLDRPTDPSRGGGDIVGLDALDLPDPVRAALEGAAADVLDGDHDRGVRRLEQAVSSICEREHPELRPAGDRTVACHLYPRDGPEG